MIVTSVEPTMRYLILEKLHVPFRQGSKNMNQTLLKITQSFAREEISHKTKDLVFLEDMKLMAQAQDKGRC